MRPSEQSFATSFPIRVFDDVRHVVRRAKDERAYRSSEGDLLDEIMSAQSFTQSWCVVKIGRQYIHHTRLETSLLGQMCQSQHTKWSLRARLDDHSTSSCKCGAARAEDHGDWEVPWNKSCGDTDGLLDGDQSSTRSRRLRNSSIDSLSFTREPPREARGIVDFSSCFRERLSSFMRHDLRKILLVLTDERVPFEEQLSACTWIHELILLEGGIGGLDCGIDIFSCVVRRTGPVLASSWICAMQSGQFNVLDLSVAS